MSPHPSDLTALQADVFAELDDAYPGMLTTAEVAQRRTGRSYDGQRTYRALRQLERKGAVVGFRLPGESVGWAVATREVREQRP